MKIFVLFLKFFLLAMVIGCSKSPEMPANEELRAETSIHHNLNEAKKAQKEYLRLQEKRSH